MAKESPEQQEVVERAMHEFKHGELKGRDGKPVKNPKQAIAIGLSEAGASNRQTPEENKERLSHTRANERRGRTGKAQADGDPSKAELYAEARKKDVPGRSKMTKAELERAVRG